MDERAENFYELEKQWSELLHSIKSDSEKLCALLCKQEDELKKMKKIAKFFQKELDKLSS